MRKKLVNVNINIFKEQEKLLNIVLYYFKNWFYIEKMLIEYLFCCL